MTFASFYLIALLAPLVGLVWWWFDARIHLLEVLLVTAVAFATAFLVHWGVARGMTSDQEVWSGEVLHVRYRPAWRERYTVTTETTHERSDGSTYTTSHTSTHYRNHPDEWWAVTSLDQELEITLPRYRQIGNAFGGESEKVRGKRHTSEDDSEMVSGDPYDYLVRDRTSHTEPVVKTVWFENRVKASPSVFSYVRLTEEQAAALPDYPYDEPWVSGRVIGAPVSIRSWDEMMAKLGPQKKVNLILVRMSGLDQAQLLEAKWVGGKKNDLVLTYGAGWAYVFGWTEEARVKRELETLLLTRPVDDALLPAIDRTVRDYYRLVDWAKFDYLDLQPRWYHVLILVFVMALTQVLTFGFALGNDDDCPLDFRD